MSNELQNLCNEILKDENGNTIEPSCGIEKLLCCLINAVSNTDTTDLNGGYPDSTT